MMTEGILMIMVAILVMTVALRGARRFKNCPPRGRTVMACLSAKGGPKHGTVENNRFTEGTYIVAG